MCVIITLLCWISFQCRSKLLKTSKCIHEHQTFRCSREKWAMRSMTSLHLDAHTPSSCFSDVKASINCRMRQQFPLTRGKAVNSRSLKSLGIHESVCLGLWVWMQVCVLCVCVCNNLSPLFSPQHSRPNIFSVQTREWYQSSRQNQGKINEEAYFSKCWVYQFFLLNWAYTKAKSGSGYLFCGLTSFLTIRIHSINIIYVAHILGVLSNNLILFNGFYTTNWTADSPDFGDEVNWQKL